MTDRPLIKASMIVHIMITPKGGAGKTETADVLEAVLSLSGQRPLLIDVDDGNRALTRRIGNEHVIPLNWASGPEDAPAWLRRYATSNAPMIFDLGAGLMSADLPILAFLSSVWRLLHDQGARIIFHCIASTNAPAYRFIRQILDTYGRIAEMMIVFNNQDGSRAFPADIAERQEPKLKLDHLYPGLQSVRLLKKAPLSTLIAEPMIGYTLATKLIAARVCSFARQLTAASLLDPVGLAKLETLPAGMPRRLQYAIGDLFNATDDRIARNARLAQAHQRLISADLNSSGLLSAAEDYRIAHTAWIEKSTPINR